MSAPVAGRTVEGYIDLFVETPEGGIIVDYKTDQWPDDGERAERVARYRRQLAAYGVALEETLGEPIAGGILVRCRAEHDAEQIDVPDWADALAEVRALVTRPAS